MEADDYAFYSDEEDDGYGGWEYVGGDSDSVVAPAATPPLQLTGISPDSAYAGDSLAISLQGTCTGANPTVTTDASDIMIVGQVNSSVTYNGGGVSCGYTETIVLQVLVDQRRNDDLHSDWRGRVELVVYGRHQYGHADRKPE